MLNVYELNVFLHAAETQNFSEAARRLHLSQPAVSLNIKSLEAELGIDLFQNVGRNVVLTDAGRALMPMAGDLVAMSKHIELSVHALRGQVVGDLPIACASSAARCLLPGMIGAYRLRFGDVRVCVSPSDAATLSQRILDRQAHIGLSSVADQRADLECRELLEDELVLIVPPGHPWVSRDDLTLRHLPGQPLILREEGAGSRRLLLNELAKLNMRLEDLNVAMQLGSHEELLTAVEIGLGVAFVSRIASARCLSAGRVTTVPLPECNLRHHIFMIRARRQPSSPAQSSFWDLAYSSGMAGLTSRLAVV
jgi:DNA-binding transcriptional LysR family regulator